MQVQPTPNPNPEQTQHHRDVLNDLIDMGHAIARRIHAKAMAEPPAPDAPGTAPGTAPANEPDPTIPFDRIARTIRRTIALARTLDTPPPVRTPRASGRRRILRTVENIIARDAPPARRDALHAELHERLDTPELAEALDDDIDQGRPIFDIIAELCADLGIAASGLPPSRRRTPADIAALIARAAPSKPGAAAIQGPRTNASGAPPEPPRPRDDRHHPEPEHATAALKPPW